MEHKYNLKNLLYFSYFLTVYLMNGLVNFQDNLSKTDKIISGKINLLLFLCKITN
jgi:hypothetical protein